MSIYCKIGTVNSQKTTNLLAAAKSYDLQNRKILCIKPSADTRDVGVIKSRVGLERECYTLEPESEALSKIIVEYSEKNNVDHVDAIFIDEGQFLSEENVKEIIVLSAGYNFNFLVYGLTSTYTGQPFISMTTLMIFAKDIEEISKEYEMEKVMLCDNLPQNLTFPEAYTLYFDIVKRYIDNKDRAVLQERYNLRRSDL